MLLLVFCSALILRCFSALTIFPCMYALYVDMSVVTSLRQRNAESAPHGKRKEKEKEKKTNEQNRRYSTSI
ncbi:hypothetical protein BZA05DRAFT_393628 [Tricharina praecox]|uniref:uncharacterized protein n=1 Tax=Tricharina praecox TaxID=43433 RepID=UPI002220D471|nr:uncharacterized protein BZA05DRAFT_393628 [Tricharina praecox]KAI5854243.1 hypothetical protein BZA05DRAFT_393628 [Tricharina praecox]